MIVSEFVSKRADGRAHWPKGKPRNATPAGRWVPLRIRLVGLLEAYPRPGVRSRRALAAHLKVGHSSVARWLSRGYTPPPRLVGRVEAWVDRQLDAIAAAR